MEILPVIPLFNGQHRVPKNGVFTYCTVPVFTPYWKNNGSQKEPTT